MADVGRLRADAGAIRSAALAAVDPARLVAARLGVVAGGLVVDGRPLDPPLDLARIERIVVVGGGKAAAAVAAGVEQVLGPEGLARHRVTGLVSVPDGAAAARLEAIEARATRPAGENLPTPAVVDATREMLDLVGRLGPRDLVVAVITGGGSALVAAPRAGYTLEEKIALIRRLSAAGADIRDLNAARRAMSDVKGGGLARACRACRLLVLVLSDVIGDDLEVIASGPCMPGDPAAADGTWTTPAGCVVRHVVVGSNADAVAAAAHAAEQLGYETRVRHAGPGGVTQASADEVGRRLAAEGRALVEESRRDGRPRAIVEGGESTVTVPAAHGLGGRNQQTVVAAIEAVLARGDWPEELLLESLGTDGEDGPTTAAGGVADAAVASAAAGLDVAGARARRDASPLLAAAGGLVITGPTGTNVCDVRIVLVRP